MNFETAVYSFFRQFFEANRYYGDRHYDIFTRSYGIGVDNSQMKLQ